MQALACCYPDETVQMPFIQQDSGIDVFCRLAFPWILAATPPIIMLGTSDALK
ncbi:MAG: hypothetical protein OJF50_002409 [Nitrospira sp.]|jgi:hypothetical protein|nr:hypothetical protein [Nitrospira sp.]